MLRGRLRTFQRSCKAEADSAETQGTAGGCRCGPASFPFGLPGQRPGPARRNLWFLPRVCWPHCSAICCVPACARCSHGFWETTATLVERRCQSPSDHAPPILTDSHSRRFLWGDGQGSLHHPALAALAGTGTCWELVTIRGAEMILGGARTFEVRGGTSVPTESRRRIMGGWVDGQMDDGWMNR